MTVVNESLKNKKLKKSNQEIGFVVEEGDLSKVGRRLYNGLIYHTQRLTKGALPAGLEWEEIEAPASLLQKSLYFLLLEDLVGDSSVGKHYEDVLGLLKQLMHTSVKRRGYASYSTLLPEVHLLKVLHSNKDRVKKWVVGWGFTPSLEKEILTPNAYTTISLFPQSRLKTECAQVLYEIGQKNIAVRSMKTQPQPWREWQEILVSPSSRRDEYKNFKRDHLKVALAKINELSDIRVEMIEKYLPGSARAVGDLFFMFSLPPQEELLLSDDHSVVDMSVLFRLREKGVVLKKAEALINDFGEERCAANLVLYANTPTADSAGWLVAAIENDYAATATARKKVALEQKGIVKKQSEGAEVIAKKNTKQAADTVTQQAGEFADVMQAFVGLDAAIQDELWNKYRASPAKTILKSIEKKENGGEPMSRDALLKVAKVQAGFAALVKNCL